MQIEHRDLSRYVAIGDACDQVVTEMRTLVARQGRRRSSPAIPPRERLIELYFACYRNDYGFRTALVYLYMTHKAALAELARHNVHLQPDHFWKKLSGISAQTRESIAAIEAFAKCWKLDVLFPEGCDELCGWLMSSMVAWREKLVDVRDDGKGNIWPVYRFDEDSPEISPDVEGFGVRFGIPSVFLRVPDIEYDADNMYAVVRLGSERIGTCAPELESVAQIKARLQPLVPRSRWGELAAEIERIHAEYERVGYETPDTANQLPLHISWLYRRVVHGEGCTAIARAAVPEVDAPTVRTPTDKYAKTLGIPQENLHARPRSTH